MSIRYPSIRMAHLTLRPLVESDAPVLLRIYQTEGVLAYFPNPVAPPLDRVQRFIQQQQEHWGMYGYGDWGILPDGETQVIGWAGLQYLPELEETEVGFLLDRPFWGKGYATEASRASLSYGFERSSLDHIIALVHPGNLASQRVIDKCGMIYQNSLSLWGIELRRYRVDRSSPAEIIDK
jgi:ribosomal-protein-alanine N-acetyltransferase